MISYLFLLFCVMVCFVFSVSLVLFKMQQKLNIPNNNFRNALKNCFILGVIYFVLEEILYLVWISDSILFLNLRSIGLMIFVIVLFYVFLTKKYHINWKQNAGYCVGYATLISILVFFSLGFIRRGMIDFYKIEGTAMSPTIQDGDCIFINKLERKFSRGDIVIFTAMEDNFLFVERIIGLPGEKIEINQGQVFINQQILQEDYVMGTTEQEGIYFLAQDEYFVLGDNRSKSLDSLDFGPIKEKNIQGKLFFSK